MPPRRAQTRAAATQQAPTAPNETQSIRGFLVSMMSWMECQEWRLTEGSTPSIQENMGTLLKEFRHVNPPSFRGEPDPMVEDRWRAQLEKIFIVMGCTKEQKVTLAIFLLDGEAEQWWELVSRSAKPGAMWNWRAFCDWFKKKYFLSNVRQKKVKEFETLQQDKMTMAQYKAHFVELLRFASHLIADEDLKAQRFKLGLRGVLRSHAVAQKLPTYDEVVDLALVIEADLEDQLRDKDQRRDGKGKKKVQYPRPQHPLPRSQQ
ncbi:uncharacterized protein LOC131217494 [Magnolia sinica]|uniref:uncharacterized protein LOC131217494 n=1 Tax=Magnolia sinica TaxID=86752 RepID=UPI0026586C96|nr:uncharacterized protein LOC131217494 [Magnolia sinica]